MIKRGRSVRDARAVSIAPSMGRSDDGGVKRQDSIRSGWIFSFPKPWRTITFNFWACLLFPLLCAFYGSTFFFQHNDLLRGIVSSDCLFVSLSANVRNSRAVFLGFRINRCPVFGDNFSQILERNLISM